MLLLRTTLLVRLNMGILSSREQEFSASNARGVNHTMLFDRILEDSLSFIRRMLWSRKDNTVSKRPFQPTKSIDGDFGIVYLLEGRDTPRAVRTWMYSPKRQHLNSAQMVATKVPMDLHIYMDFLEPLSDNVTQAASQERKVRAQQRQQGASVNTHRLQILKASHFLSATGFYEYELVFWKDFDFYPSKEIPFSKKLNEEAIAIKFADALAFRCLDIATPLKFKTEEWEEVVDEVVTALQTKLRSAT